MDSELRRRAVIAPWLPPLSFRRWLHAMAHRIPALAALTSSMWRQVGLALDGTVYSPMPVDPVQHLAFLAHLRELEAARPIVPFLGWIVPAGTPGAVALDGGGRAVWAALGTNTIASLVEAKLVRRVPLNRDSP